MNIDTLAKEKRNEYMRRYMREWRKKNKDKVREYNRNYWIRKAKAEKEKADKSDQV